MVYCLFDYENIWSEFLDTTPQSNHRVTFFIEAQSAILALYFTLALSLNCNIGLTPGLSVIITITAVFHVQFFSRQYFLAWSLNYWQKIRKLLMVTLGLIGTVCSKNNLDHFHPVEVWTNNLLENYYSTK